MSGVTCETDKRMEVSVGNCGWKNWTVIVGIMGGRWIVLGLIVGSYVCTSQRCRGFSTASYIDVRIILTFLV